MLEFPKLGSSRHGRAHVFSKDVKSDYSRMVGVPLAEANFVVDALGAVIQNRLLQGKPCGIPFVGVIYVKFQRNRRFHVSGVAHHPNFPDSNAKEVQYPMFSQPALYCSRIIKEAIRDEAPYTGSLDDMYHHNMESVKERYAVTKKMKEAKKRREKRSLEAKLKREKVKKAVRRKGTKKKGAKK